MRDNQWLEEKLDNIWREYFSDIERINNVTIKFGKKARARLGSIKQLRCHPEHREGSHGILRFTQNDKSSPSVITLTGYFKDERVPEYIIDSTIAHELCHYAHGFSSPHPQASKHPHSGGVVDNELKARGFEKELKDQKKWLKEVWPTLIDKPKRRIRRRRTRRIVTLKDAFKFLISG